MGLNIDNRCGVPCTAALSLPKSSPRKTMPLVFMTRGEREARSSKFYPGALRFAHHPDTFRYRFVPAPPCGFLDKHSSTHRSTFQD